MRNWKSWTQEDDQRLAALYRGGALKEEIAAELGRSLSSVQGRLHAKRLLPPRPPITPDQVAAWLRYKEQGVPLKRVARETGVPPVTIRRRTGKWSSKTWRVWKAAEVKRVREMYQAGLPLKVIAAEVGRDGSQISARLKGFANRNQRWTAENSLALELLWIQGKARKQIAKTLGKKEATVALWVRKLGLASRKPGRKP